MYVERQTVKTEPPDSAERIMRLARSTSGRWPRSVATQRAILDAAITLFAEKGYDNTSIDEIVKLSGVSVGSIYHQFDGKADVFLALAAEDLNMHIDASRRQMEQTRAKGGDGKAVYLSGAFAFLMSSWRHRQVVKVMICDEGPPGYVALRRKTEMVLSHRATSQRMVGDPPNDDCGPMAIAALMTAATLQMVSVESPLKARKIARYFTGLIGHLIVAQEEASDETGSGVPVDRGEPLEQSH